MILEEVNNFDPSILNAETPFTQAGFYGDWQKALGREVKRYIVKEGSEIIAYFQMIKYPLLLGKSYFYIPYGPVIKNTNPDQELLLFIKEEINKINKKEKAIFTRLDFTPVIPNEILGKYFTKTPLCACNTPSSQPRTEWFLKLDKTENALLMSMDASNRQSVRTAEKKNITVEIATENFTTYFETFYKLMTGTAKRNGFGLHAREYYLAVFNNLAKIQNAYLVIAKYEEKILLIKMIIIYNGVANDVFTGSSNEERNRRPTYLAIWKAVLQAKKLNCKYYNFGGITDGENNSPDWGGITSFKKKFGGFEVKHSNFYDVVTNPLIYYLYNLRKFLKSLHP